ncbi:trypsin-like peptidase domain-containing protein [Clostridium sp. D33t1_170424_F3]|uniref:trypsin-like peptidase domain-containing protein n=1 Tax=Clostridium sp. D33t1_170424_F3 TaxID=2787099 RepID=UPI0018A9F802|nr:trypsin-like peptidase domain-containing protein [Clostridium sp. D33t1_170424_F3]
MKKMIAVLTACALMASTVGCASLVKLNGAADQNQALGRIMSDLSDGNMLTDSDGRSVPDTDYLPLPEFEALEPNTVFDVDWKSVEGDFMAGTSFLAKTDLSDRPLLLTACHYFTSDEMDVDLRDLTGYISGGDLYDVLGDGGESSGTVAGVVPIPDAESVSENGNPDRDLAAFYVDGAGAMGGIPFAADPCEMGDVIYLAAWLDHDNSVYYDDCLYPCVVTQDDGKEIGYILSDEFSTQGASGAPLLNGKGELVGIHIGSNGSLRYGHSAQSIREQLENALAK